MDRNKDILAALDDRRRELGMSLSVLARRSGVSLPTLQRVLRGRNGGMLATLEAIARALGTELRPPRLKPSPDVASVRREQARQKAKKLVALTLGNAALERRFVDEATERRFVRETEQELLNGSNHALWA